MTAAEPPIRRAFRSQRLTLDYVDWGNAGAPTVILLHGGRDHARSWDAVAQALRPDWHVVAPDLRGHGDSGWSPDGAYASPFLIGDLAALVEQLGSQRVAIVAHSLGGVVALRYAALFPERVTRLAAIEGIGLDHPAGQAPLLERWRDFVERRLVLGDRPERPYPTLDAAVVRMREANPRLDATLALHLTEHAVRRSADGYRWKYDPMFRAPYPADLTNDQLREVWRAVRCPVWLVHGAESWAAHPEAEGRAAEFRDARITSFDRAGHWPHHDRTEAFTAALRDFLAR